MPSSALLSTITGLAVFVSLVDADGTLYQPKATFTEGSGVNWVVQIDNNWDIGSGGDQVGKFTAMAKEKGMSVRDVVLDMVGSKKCGISRTDVGPQPIPSDGKAIWLGNGGGGFSHTGPCELYIDDRMVLHGDNCEDEFPGGTGGMSEMPVDYSSCKGNCVFTIYWLAFQNEQWQAYINCVPISGSGASTTTQTSGSKSTETLSTGAPETPSTKMESTESPATKTESAGTPSTENKETTRK